MTSFCFLLSTQLLHFRTSHSICYYAIFLLKFVFFFFVAIWAHKYLKYCFCSTSFLLTLFSHSFNEYSHGYLPCVDKSYFHPHLPHFSPVWKAVPGLSTKQCTEAAKDSKWEVSRAE